MSNSRGYGVSDSLLPLLDVSMLLLGLFIIILVVSNQKEDNDPEPDAPGLAGNVVIVSIERDARLMLHTQEGIIDVPNVQVLRQAHFRGFSRDTVVLVQVEDPWCARSSQLYKESLQAVTDTGLSRSRVY